MNQLNEYMKSKIESHDQEDLCEDILSDAALASDFGVKSDQEYGLYFYLNNIVDDLVGDTFGVTLDEKHSNLLKKYIYSFKDNRDYNLKDLVDLRILAYKWLSELPTKKTAHPNISGIYIKQDSVDIGKWIATAKEVYNTVHTYGISRDKALKHHTESWDSDERFKFDNWLKYYEGKNTERYNVKTANIIKTAFGPESLTFPKEWEKPENRQSTVLPFQANDGKTKKELEIDRAKSFKAKMKSRIRALKVLLDKYNDLLPHQNLDKILDEVVLLEKSIGKLNVYAALQDRTIRSAESMKKLGFVEGADLLKEAADPISDATNLPAGGALKINIENIITRLEGISKILKMRDTIRELSKADIMLSELGMSSYFPEITDAISKLIEGFGYASNRIESVVAKLRGSGKPKVAPAPLPTAPTAPGPGPMTPTVPVAPALVSAPQEKLEPSALHERPISKVKTELPTTPKPGI